MSEILHVEVYIPDLMKSYEFSLNEHVKISAVIDEIAHVISQKEQKPWEKSKDILILCNCINGTILPMEKSLYQCHVGTGSKLILV